MFFRVTLIVSFNLLHDIKILQGINIDRTQIPVQAAHYS